MKEGPHSAHWGTFFARFDGAAISVRPHPADPAPSPLLYNLTNAIRHNVRVPTPMVRRGWLEHGPGPDDRRGNDEYVPVSWDRAIGLVAGEIGRVRDLHGPQANFGGSYGWSSAGRFHHAQSQVHRVEGDAVPIEHQAGHLRVLVVLLQSLQAVRAGPAPVVHDDLLE